MPVSKTDDGNAAINGHDGNNAKISIEQPLSEPAVLILGGAMVIANASCFVSRVSFSSFCAAGSSAFIIWIWNCGGMEVEMAVAVEVARLRCNYSNKPRTISEKQYTTLKFQSQR